MTDFIIKRIINYNNCIRFDFYDLQMYPLTLFMIINNKRSKL